MRPLRIAALAILMACIAAAAWLYFGDPGMGDPYYAAAKARQGLPFVAATAAFAVLVFLAGGTARSRGRWAATGLWLALIGPFMVTASLLIEFAIPAAHPRRYPEYGEAYLIQLQLLNLAGMVGAVSLVAGGMLWLLSYRLDRVRDAG